jgi:hypothetical protein
MDKTTASPAQPTREIFTRGLQALSDSDRACIAQCRTAHRSSVLLDRVFACLLKASQPNIRGALSARSQENKRDLIMQ